MYLINYIIGSYYIVRSLFRFSENTTQYLFNNNIIKLPISKFDKINESIYSSLHGLLVSVMASMSITNSLFYYNSLFIKDISPTEKDNELQSQLKKYISFNKFLDPFIRTCTFYICI